MPFTLARASHPQGTSLPSNSPWGRGRPASTARHSPCFQDRWESPLIRKTPRSSRTVAPTMRTQALAREPVWVTFTGKISGQR